MRDNLTPRSDSRGAGILSRAQNMRAEQGPSPLSSPLKGEGKTARAARLVAVGAIAIYRAAVSPVIHALNGPACRFEPSCSEYARDAIAEYGIVRGGAMAIWRVARCNPMGGHGFDPVRGRGAEGER